MLDYNIKRRLFASFFLLFLAGAHAWALEVPTKAITLLSHDKQWDMLLHAPYTKQYIKDPKFYFSHPFDKERELIATVQAFQSTEFMDDRHPICRFPARYLWLKTKLHWHDSDFPSPHCISYQSFLKHVPIERVQLVFASENITSPTSMMGHVFLKLEGMTAEKFYAEHAITYFTVLDSFNIPKIVYENFAGGLGGIFALQPYVEIKRNYLEKEGRNIWEYQLHLTQAQKTLLRAHIWELKGIQSDYLFADYNCATVTYLLMGLIYPEILDERFLWVTPIDVIKLSKKYGLFSSVIVETSNQWKIQMLLDNTENYTLTPKQLLQIQPEEAASFIQMLTPNERLLGLAYLTYLKVHKPTVYQARKRTYAQVMVLLEKATQDYVLDYTQYKNPIKAPGSSQVQVSIGQYHSEHFMDVSILPAANRLTDDQRQFFSSHALKMAHTRVRIYAQKLKLRSFDILNVRSFNPWNIWTQNLSGQWRVGWETHRDALFNEHLVFNVTGGLGYTAQLGQDTLVSAIYNVGMAANLTTGYAYHYPELIMQFNEVLDMKTTVYAQRYFHMYGTPVFNHFKVCQSYYPSRNHTWLVCAQQQVSAKSKVNAWSLAFQQHF